jgi:RNA polymerase sigma factor (sigma-70 family)
MRDEADDESAFDHAEALRACARGERWALRALYEHEAPRLLGVALRIVRDRALAEDVLHDAFVSVWTRAASFDPARGAARGWIHSIVRHRALDVVRAGARMVGVDEETAEALDAEASMQAAEALASALELRASIGRLEHCLQALEAPKRASILYAYVDGCSHAEIAERLATPLGTVKAWIRRGLIALRECMA